MLVWIIMSDGKFRELKHDFQDKFASVILAKIHGKMAANLIERKSAIELAVAGKC